MSGGRIGLAITLPEDLTDRLRRNPHGFSVHFLHDGEPGDCAIIFGNPPPESLAGQTRLAWLQLESVGFGDYADVDFDRAGGRVLVTNLAGFFAEPVAETMLAGILSLKRGLAELVRLQTAAHWLGDAIRPRMSLLAGSDVLMIGRGSINGRLGELLIPFGCRFTRIGADTDPARLDAAIPRADIIACAAPDTPLTRNLLNRDRLMRLKPGAILVNAGRGSLIDEAALAEITLSGRIAGAVIDVTRDEPLPADHPFWSIPNILITQHSAGGSQDELARKVDWFLDNLDRFSTGRPLRGMVDLSRGY